MFAPLGLANGRYRVHIKDCEQLVSGDYELAVEEDYLKLYHPGQSELEGGEEGHWMFVAPTLLPLCPVYCTEVLQCILFSLIVGTREGKSGHYIEGKRM